MNDFDRRWQRISQLLSMEATGKERPMFSSGRTLFGVKSTAEEKMGQFAREIEEEHAAKRKAAREAENKASQTDKKQEMPDTSTTRFVASNAYIRSSVEELTDRALKQTIRDANKKLEEDYKSGKTTKRKKFNAE